MILQVGDSTDNIQTVPFICSTHGKHKSTSVHLNLSSAELFNLYTMLNDVKVDLLWGRNSEEQPEEMSLKQTDHLAVIESNNKFQPQPLTKKGHVRSPSTASVASFNSTNTLSDTESELYNENDSGIESEHNMVADRSSDLARQYRTHLLGLYRCLEQMTEAAKYLTERYQSDIGPV